jgi:dolichyl-phosphate-mannose--protein O-mannosyl transferase
MDACTYMYIYNTYIYIYICIAGSIIGNTISAQPSHNIRPLKPGPGYLDSDLSQNSGKLLKSYRNIYLCIYIYIYIYIYLYLY